MLITWVRLVFRQAQIIFPQDDLEEEQSRGENDEQDDHRRQERCGSAAG